MKQILIKRSNTITENAGTKIILKVNSKILPSMSLPAKKTTILEIPLEVKVMTGGEDWDFVFKLNKMLGIEGVTAWAEKVKDVVQVVLFNNSEYDLSLYEGAPIVEAIMVPLVSFRQIDNTFREDGVVVITSEKEERRGEAQIKKAKKNKKKN
jgi:hypothetical protein